jgi:hypothetical protein
LTEPHAPFAPDAEDAPSGDDAIEAVRSELRQIDPTGDMVARVLRDTIDQLLDGQHTGRYQWEKLRKTEKTHAGTLVEINLQKALDLRDGVSMDYCVAGHDVDCKFSQTFGGWEIPPEAWRDQHLCLVIWARDADAAWTAGLIRASDAYLGAANRDLKRKLTLQGRNRIRWVWRRSMVLPENVLLVLDQSVVADIMSGQSGQVRINRLFRAAQQHRISRGVVATVAREDDFMKRVRANGGARTALKPEGIVILGEYAAHREYAQRLGLPIPASGESVSVQLTRGQLADARPYIELDGARWVVAEAGDRVEEAPLVPYSAGNPAPRVSTEPR